MAKRKTHEEFVNEMKEVNPNIDILGEYVNSKEKILCKCKIDNNEWCATPTNLLRGRGCPVCGRKLVNKNRKKTHDDFVNEMSNKNPNIDILGRYINAKTKILCKCKIDGYEWETSPSHLSAGRGCPKCGRNVRTRTTEQFIDEMKIVNPNLQILGEFTKADNKILTKCLVCEHEWTPKAIQLLDGHGCPICAKMSRRKTHEEFIEEASKIRPDIKIKSKYTKSDEKIDCECEYGHKWSTRPHNILKGFGCPVCSGNYKSISSRLKQKGTNLWETDPDIAKYLNNPEDGYNVTCGSRRILEWKCPICGHIQSRKIHTIKANGFICEICNDGFSKPEKFMRSVLIQLGIDFEMQAKFEWAKNKKYDFYFDGIICETHGLQHYEHGFQCNGARTLEEEQLNDTYKEKVAKENGFNDDTYIVIDCRKTDKEWIKNSILHSKLADYYDLSIIDWDKCEKDTLSSIVIEICNLWNQGYSTSDIKRKMHLSKNTSTVSKYLNICNNLGLCNYDPKQSQKDGSNHKVVCLNTSEIFESIAIAEGIYNVQNVSGCCIGQTKSAGKHPKTKEPLVWRHYEDYVNMSEEDIELALDVKSKKLRKVICITTMQVFDSLVEGAIYAGLKNSSSLSACFRNEQKYAGKHPETGEPLKWMPYDKYLESIAS